MLNIWWKQPKYFGEMMYLSGSVSMYSRALGPQLYENALHHRFVCLHGHVIVVACIEGHVKFGQVMCERRVIKFIPTMSGL